LGAKEGLEEIKKAKFFAPINWSAIEKREMPGPLKPNITGGQTDVENFASGREVFWKNNFYLNKTT